MAELDQNTRQRAGKAQMRQFLEAQFLEWHLVAIKSIRGILLDPEAFYKTWLPEQKKALDIVNLSNVAVEVKTGWLYEAVSHAEQAIEDLFSLLKNAQSPDYFARNVVIYKAWAVKDYIWNFKYDDVCYIANEFHFPFIDRNNNQSSLKRDDFEKYRKAMLLMQEYLEQLVKFHKRYYLDYCQYKHGLAVSLSFEKTALQKPTQGVLKTYDSYPVGTRMNQTKGTPFMGLDLDPEVIPYYRELHDEKNLLHYTIHTADIDEFISIVEKAYALIRPLRSNLISTSSLDEKTSTHEYMFPDDDYRKMIRISFEE